MLAFKGWYCDSTHRYQVTDAVQPLIVRSANARKPATDPKADLARYYMLAHGSHLVDTARFLCGDIVSVDARLTQRYGAYCWFIATEFANGAVGHLDLTVSVRMDWHEGVQIYGEHGSVLAKTYNPWAFKSSDVEIFREADATYARPLGADAHFYRRQVEACRHAFHANDDDRRNRLTAYKRRPGPTRARIRLPFSLPWRIPITCRATGVPVNAGQR